MNSFGFLIDEGERMEVLLRQFQAGAPEGWRPNRIIFRNFWFFDQEEFWWHHGRLFLGGQNAAGKSTVLSMAVPFLLDGNKSEERLNTFGGQGRHMAYYVTGSSPDETGETSYSYPVRTSYLALEFSRTAADGSETFLTFGQGLHHDRSGEDKTVRSWGFVVRDGRRIGRVHDGLRFDLVRENRLSLTRAELKKLLSTGGEVFETNRDYQREINRLLFGFKDGSDFDALIDLLIQIRRPKLTKEVRPRDVAEILTRSLPSLDEAVTQITATSLDHIDQTTQNLERLADEIEAARGVERATRDVFRRMTEVAAAQYERAYRAAAGASASLAAQEAKRAEAQAAYAAANNAQSECQQQLTALDEEEQGLQQNDAIRAAEELAQAEQELRSLETAQERLAAEVFESEHRLRRYQKELQAAEESWSEQRDAGLEAIGDADEPVAASRWESAAHWLAEVRERWQGLLVAKPDLQLLEAIPRAAVAAGVLERTAQIAEAERAVVERDEAQAVWSQARSEEQQALVVCEQADAASIRAETDLSARRAEAAAAVRTWAGSTAALAVPAELVADMAGQLERYRHGDGLSPRQALAPVSPAVQAALGEVNQAASVHRLALERLLEAGADLRAQRQRLDEAPPEPARSVHQMAARRLLAAAGIAFAPLYEITAFRPGLAPADCGRVEAALMEMGLLDALLVAPEEREAALALLRQGGPGERVLLTASQVEGLGSFLESEADHPLGAAVSPLLGDGAEGSLTGGALAAVGGDGFWRQGLLAGTGLPQATVRYMGRTARERFRKEEIQRLDELLAANEAACRVEKQALADLNRRSEAIQRDQARLEQLPELERLAQAGQEQAFRAQKLEEAKAALHLAQEKVTRARQTLDAAEIQVTLQWERFPPVRGLSRAGLQELARQTSAVKSAFDEIYTQARLLLGAWKERSLRQEQCDSEQSTVDDRFNRQEEGAIRLRGLSARCAGLHQVIDAPDAQTLFRRLSAIKRERPKLLGQREQALEARGAAGSTIAAADASIPELGRQAAESSTRAANARQSLHDAVMAYPTLEQHQFPATDAEAARRVAATILARWSNRPDLVEDIRREEVGDRDKLSNTFARTRSRLENYYPVLTPGERTARLVQFNWDGASVTPHLLLAFLEEDEQAMRGVLQQDEAELFERHLLQDVGREVRRCMLKARDWVAEINALLQLHPLRNEERVKLEWEPKQTEHELGGTIARHANLLWIEAADLTATQRDTLKSAFQEEISQIREQARRGEWRADLFRQRLTEVLDYRTWFRFRLYVLGGVTGRTEITDTVHNARSGSERALVLLFPLLAGLSVRYDSAGTTAPRLLALDEAFAGIDPVNSRQLIRFLTALRLTWVVSSEKLPALTSDLPGASFYAMLREGTVVAARPFIWDGQELKAADSDFGPEAGGRYDE